MIVVVILSQDSLSNCGRVCNACDSAKHVAVRGRWDGFTPACKQPLSNKMRGQQQLPLPLPLLLPAPSPRQGTTQAACGRRHKCLPP